MSLTNASAEDAAREAKTASFALASLSAAGRNAALDAIHAALSAAKDDILAANARDLELARKAAADGSLSEALVSRLDLGKKGKWEDMLKGINDVRDLEDPGRCLAITVEDILLTDSSRQDPDAHQARRRLPPRARVVPDWRAAHHLRGQARSHCQHCQSGYQIRQRRHSQGCVLLAQKQQLY